MIAASQILRNFSLKTPCLYFATKASPQKKRIPLVTCKNKTFDLYLNDKNRRINPDEDPPLATKGWAHYKAKGDHFTIHPTRSAQDVLVGGKEFKEMGLNEQLVKNLDEKHDITKATKTQLDCMKEIFNDQHVLLAAETGCGKVKFNFESNFISFCITLMRNFFV